MITKLTNNSPPASSAIADELADLTPISTFRELEVFRFSGNDCPVTLTEIGHIREVAYRERGAGRGLEYDLDDLDTGHNAYIQLIVWDPGENQLVALYRYQLGSRAADGKTSCLRTSSLFDYSETFKKEVLPYSLELGRSVVNASARRSRLGFYAIWKGLGALLHIHSNIRYFFGNVSLYKTMPPSARDGLIRYLHRHYAPPEPMLIAKKQYRYNPGKEKMPGPVETGDLGLNETDLVYPVEPGEEDNPGNRIKRVNRLLKPNGETLPAILKSYMSLSNRIWFGETTIDHNFGDAFETGIIVPVQNIRHVIRKVFIDNH